MYNTPTGERLRNDFYELKNGKFERRCGLQIVAVTRQLQGVTNIVSNLQTESAWT